MKLFGGEQKKFRVIPRSATEEGEAESPRWLSAIERLVDEATGVAGAAQHQRFVSATAPVGAEDRGFAHLTMNVNQMKK